MRRSRRWIELRAAAGQHRPEPEGPGEPGSADDRDVAPAPSSPSPPPSPFSEMTSLAARMAMAPILESGRYFRAVTAHTVRSTQAKPFTDRD